MSLEIDLNKLSEKMVLWLADKKLMARVVVSCRSRVEDTLRVCDIFGKQYIRPSSSGVNQIFEGLISVNDIACLSRMTEVFMINLITRIEES